MTSVSVSGTFPKTAMNNRSVERTVKVTTCICSTMLVVTYTDKNNDYKKCAVKQTSHISTHYFSSIQKHLLLFIKQLGIPKYTKHRHTLLS